MANPPLQECIDEEQSENKKYYTEQLRAQDLFWTTSIKQYNDHIKKLTCEQENLNVSVNSTEATMLPFITYLMIKLSRSHPNLNINTLLDKLSMQPYSAQLSESSTEVTIPDPAILQHFVIQDNDILYMDIIRSLASETKVLQSKVDDLISKENALFDTKRRVDSLFNNISKAKNLVINRKDIVSLHERLKASNEQLQCGIREARQKKITLQGRIEDTFKDLSKEEQRSVGLNHELNYAGANIEIAQAVEGGSNLNDKLKIIQDEIALLNTGYSALQKEWNFMNVEAENLRNNFIKKLSNNSKIIPSAPETIQTQSSSYKDCDCESKK